MLVNTEYVQVILENAKYKMVEFWYKILRRHFCQDIQLLYTGNDKVSISHINAHVT